MTTNNFLSTVSDIGCWETFLNHKITYQNLSSLEEKALRKFVSEKRFLYFLPMIEQGTFPNELPFKKIVNKEGTTKKRIVYSFSQDTGMILKFLAFFLYKYDHLLSPNCYAFRRDYGVGQAIRKVRSDSSYQHKYCYKTDISNYFNSIHVPLLLSKIAFIKEDDPLLYQLMERILLEPRVKQGNIIMEDFHGAMAGIPIAPFFANWYLKDVDDYFISQGIDYFRYSDDILIFADSYEKLLSYKEQLITRLKEHHLTINHAKECVTTPGEAWEFLGFSYHNGIFDLSENTKRKIKSKIKRKADALRRWQRKKQLPPDKAAIGFIRAMNHKFYGNDEDDDFCWKRWFFPYLTTSAGLKEIDSYMQEYIRYTVTGRHYKGNYQITYQQLKDWGYRSLVHKFYQKNENSTNTIK